MQQVKGRLHDLIESTNDTELLDLLVDIIEENSAEGNIWSSLNQKERADIIAAANETDQLEKQVSHSEMISRNKKWLK